MKLITPVSIDALPFTVTPGNRIMILGSCFADSVGARMAAAGFDVCINPFGTLYNPASTAAAVGRLVSGRKFTSDECVEMGAGAGKICSFSHHTSFARSSAEEFLENANASLSEAAAFWEACDTVIVTLGTAMVWRHQPGDRVVSNCLKRPAGEFTHSMLSVAEVTGFIQEILRSAPGKRFIFTVSPIRHMSQGAHVNTLSKATLHIGLDEALKDESAACYFPAFELLCDEMRDYRFYAEDLVHPSATAVEYVWEKFTDAAVPAEFRQWMHENEKAARQAAHRNILK